MDFDVWSKVLKALHSPFLWIIALSCAGLRPTVQGVLLAGLLNSLLASVEILLWLYLRVPWSWWLQYYPIQILVCALLTWALILLRRLSLRLLRRTRPMAQAAGTDEAHEPSRAADEADSPARAAGAATPIASVSKPRWWAQLVLALVLGAVLVFLLFVLFSWVNNFMGHTVTYQLRLVAPLIFLEGTPLLAWPIHHVLFKTQLGRSQPARRQIALASVLGALVGACCAHYQEYSLIQGISVGAALGLGLSWPCVRLRQLPPSPARP